MSASREHWQALWTAVGYFTHIPVPASVGFSQVGLNRVARYFPLIGWLVGAVAAAVYWPVLRTVPAQGVAVAVSMGATLLLTGVFHEDGLADCTDGFGGDYTPEDWLHIMHDSRIGVFGAIAVCMALLLKWQLLSTMAPHSIGILVAMVAAHAASRAAAASHLFMHDYVRAEGKAKPVAQRMRWNNALWAGVFGIVPLLQFGPMCVALIAVGLILARWLLGRYFVCRIGGITSDCLDMAQQTSELLILWGLLAWMSS